MKPKVTFNSNIRLPLIMTEAIHEVIEACGLLLIEQSPLQLLYQGNGKQLLIMGTQVKFQMWWDEDEQDKAAHWTTMFDGSFYYSIDEIALLDILHNLNAINYFKVPEMRQAVRTALDKVRMQPQFPGVPTILITV